MGDRDGKATREERLAARLRENLKRRKAQARAQAGTQPATPAPPEDGLSKEPEPR